MARPPIPAGCDGDPCSLLHHHAAQEQPHPELADRWQRAIEAASDEMHETIGYRDGRNLHLDLSQVFAAAIETATRVQITPEIVAAARQIATEQMHDPQAPTDPAERWKVILTAAFRAAGFEVEE